MTVLLTKIIIAATIITSESTSGKKAPDFRREHSQVRCLYAERATEEKK